MGTLWDETTVKVDQTKEFSKFGESGWERKVTNGFDFGFEWLDAVWGDFVAKKLESRNTENAFGWVYDNAILPESFEQLS